MRGAIVGVCIVATFGFARLASTVARSRQVMGRFENDAIGLSAKRTATPRRCLPTPTAVARFFDETGLDVRPDVAWWSWSMSLLAVMIAGVSFRASWPAALLAGAIATAPFVFRRHLRQRQTARYDSALPALLDAMGSSLRSGASLRQAIREVGESLDGAPAMDLAVVAEKASHGVPLSAALADWRASRREVPSIGLVVAALTLGAETGGAQARAIDGVAATTRDRLAVAVEVRALSSQARLSAVVIALAPLAFCALSASVDRRTAGFLFHTRTGGLLLAAGLSFDALGMAWMSRLTRMDR